MSKQVLVVEDEQNIAEALSFLLSHVGFEVTVARDGPEALDVIASGSPDLVLLDVMLPTMTGYEVLSKLREQHDSSTLPVIVVTAKGQEADRETARAHGANLVITKPYGNDELVEAVRSLSGA